MAPAVEWGGGGAPTGGGGTADAPMGNAHLVEPQRREGARSGRARPSGVKARGGRVGGAGASGRGSPTLQARWRRGWVATRERRGGVAAAVEAEALASAWRDAAVGVTSPVHPADPK